MAAATATFNDSTGEVTFSGNALDFGNRDFRKWVYSAFKCVTGGYAQSGKLWTFCVLSSNKQPGRLFGLCLPAPRHWDTGQFGEGVDCVDCTGYGCRESDYPSGPLTAFTCAFALLVGVLCYLVARAWRWESAGGKLQQDGGEGKFCDSALLSAFSPRANFASLFAARAPTASAIPSLDGLRVVALLWIVVGHLFMFVQGFVPNGDEVVASLCDNVANSWLANFTLSTDLFFVLSGCVCIYNGLGRVGGGGDGHGSYSWFRQHYIHRLVRLWPALAFSLAMLVVSSYSLPYRLRPALSLFTQVGTCLDGGFVMSLLFANSVVEAPVCGGHTWHISTDFIYYALLAPIVLVLLRGEKSPARGYYVFLAALVLGSALLNMQAIFANNYPPALMIWRQPTQFSPSFAMQYIHHYVKPWYRVGPYAVGMALGAELHFFDRQSSAKSGTNHNQGVLPHSPTLISSWLGCSSPASSNLVLYALLIIGWSMAGLYPALQDWHWPIYHVVYGGVFRSAFAVGVAWLIYACHTGCRGSHQLNWVLSHPYFLPFSALSYSLYTFTTASVLLPLVLSLHPAWYTGVVGMLPVYLIILVVGFGYALSCYMMVELPALKLERLLRKGRSRGGGGDEVKLKEN